MKYFILDAAHMTDKKAAHTYIADTLSFPEYYGHNLDALYDILTDFFEPVTITITHTDLLEKQLGASYAHLFLSVLQDSAAANDSITLNFE